MGAVEGQGLCGLKGTLATVARWNCALVTLAIAVGVRWGGSTNSGQTSPWPSPPVSTWSGAAFYGQTSHC